MTDAEKVHAAVGFLNAARAQGEEGLETLIREVMGPVLPAALGHWVQGINASPDMLRNAIIFGYLIRANEESVRRDAELPPVTPKAKA